MVLALSTFYVQTWEEYHTKTLTLGIVNGPVEGVIILVCSYLFTAYKGGASFWHQSLLRTIGVPEHALIPQFIYELAFDEVYLIQGSLFLIFNTVDSCVFLCPHYLSLTLLRYLAL